ncbi:uncharacterized protein A4U43_C03F29440 [Asparagus officinalis]|uniref:Poly [ADP-ribose] polymerase n=1 Tax=Asparagus officinalis TaxID=4686 RepID=A0A5P1FJ03_ASPOF|nr:uncharacterized protein A4U43_C03F29440 [Asparagus officinalis]
MYMISGSWVTVPSKASDTIKRCFKCRGLATRVEIQGSQFTINLLGMMMVGSDGYLLSIAWTDGNAKTFFPKKVFCGGGRAISNMESLAPTSSLPRPSFDSLGELEKLEEDSSKYKVVRDTFLKGLKKKDKTAKVTAVYSCKHSSTFGASWSRAYERVAEITAETKTTGNVSYGWYGSNPQRMQEISGKGFGLEDALHGAFGCGIYFAPEEHPSLSSSFLKPDINGEYHIMLCKVTLGNTETIREGSNQYAPSEDHHDSGVNDNENPKCYVLWTKNMSAHILPQYVISFRISEKLEGNFLNDPIV